VTVSTTDPAGEAGPSKDPATPSDGTIFNAYRRTQALVLTASLLSIVLVWQVTAYLGIPPIARLQGSLIEQPQPPVAFVAAGVLYFLAVFIGILIAGRSWFFAGIFTGAIAMATLSVRCGTMHYVLSNAAAHGDTKRIFLKLLAELCLLFVPAALAWTFFWRRFSAAAPARSTAEDEEAPKPEDNAGSIFGAIVAQIVITGLLVLFLGVTESKKQIAISVLVGSFSGTALAEYLFPSRKAAAWYWLAPFLVGAVGYVAAFLNAGDAPVATAQGALANLAHATPLDWAGAGILGMLMGYWAGGERPAIPFNLHASTKKISQ
jgi:hypothetical protein